MTRESIRVPVLGFMILLSATVLAQGIEFFHGSWEEALLKAKEEDKLIFVDAFTTWCGPCKHMAANTFPDPEVGKFFNRHFVNMKIDMEKEAGLSFGRTYPVNAYPTLLFIGADGKLVHRAVGAKKPADLIALGQSVTNSYDKSLTFEEAYAAGDRSYKLVYDYVAALNKAGKPSVRIVNEYLGGQEDLTTPDNLRFILEGASVVDCSCFDLFEKHKAAIAKLVSAEEVRERVKRACAQTVKRAIEYESRDLLALALEAMKRHVPEEADFFRSQSEIRYALALHDFSNIRELVQYHVKKHLKNDAESLHLLALDLDKFGSNDPVCSELAIDLAGKAARDMEAAYVSTYAGLLFRAGRKQEAIDILEYALIKRWTAEESSEHRTLVALRNRFQHS